MLLRCCLRTQCFGLLQRLISYANNLRGIKKLQELKLLHALAVNILPLVCMNARKCDQVNASADALFRADKEGNIEFVFQVSKANPEIMLIGDSSFRNIFCCAVNCQQARVFSLIHGLRLKDVIATSKDGHGNALLHMAATQAPASSLNHIYGPTLQMQRELQWFKLERRFWTCEGLPQQHQFTKATRLCIKDHHRRHLY
ncbi:uncharacterized protein LOC129312085 isoform X2 [Prosopis cineraria]|uniref:uncharacterized protein LOC129312085 isoform X2 n=1 Tax=Prosopis cineraria TaxID=364024 RepID=UPI00240FD955|nr:uncharacterized protein LOC129312085 isoform X2 [Prosopis cineraria]